MDAIKGVFSSQPEEYGPPNWFQKIEAKWERMSSTQKKVAKIAIPILVVIIAVGAGIGATFLAPESLQNILGPGVMLGIGGIALTGYQLSKKKWGESYALQMTKIEKDPKTDAVNGLIVKETIDCFKQYGEFFVDFDATELKPGPGQSQEEFLALLNQLVSECRQARAINLGRHFNQQTLQIVRNLPRVKKIVLDFSEIERQPHLRTVKEREDLIATVANANLKHIVLSMPPKNAKPEPGKLNPEPVELTSIFMRNLAIGAPKLKTVHLSNMNHDAWPQFARLHKLKEVNLDVETLGTMTEDQAAWLNGLKRHMWKNCPKFQQFKVTHQMRPKKADGTIDYDNYDDFKPEVRRILENSRTGNLYLEDDDAGENKAGDLTRVLTMEFRLTRRDWMYIGRKSSIADGDSRYNNPSPLLPGDWPTL